MKTLKQAIQEAEKKKIAIGHFNIATLEQLEAIARAAIKLDVPVIIGVSEGEREYLGISHIYDFVASYNKEYGGVSTNAGFWLFLNADHTHSLEKVKEAAEVGFNEILFDASKLPFKENIKETKKAVKIIKKIAVRQRKEILIEGELGYIGSSSQLLKKVPPGVAICPEDFTKPEDANTFVRETGIDLLGPAVGNVHGMFKNARNPRLDIERIREIKKAVKIPLVLHGGSGISDEDFLAAIDAGISIIHISTEIRLVWRKGLEESLKEHPGEVAPYKVMPEVIGEIEKVVEQRLRLFNKIP